MGEQVAIEAYIRAMVAEADETGTVMMGADQGFHNYLFHTNKLANSKNIRRRRRDYKKIDHNWERVFEAQGSTRPKIRMTETQVSAGLRYWVI